MNDQRGAVRLGHLEVTDAALTAWLFSGATPFSLSASVILPVHGR